MPYRTLRFLLIFFGLFFQTSLIAVASGFTIVIDPGHGGKDPGTLGSSCKEKDIVLGVGLKLGELIASKQPDVKIIFTRNTDEFIELNQRAIIANKAKANLFISIHADHADSPSPHGPSTFTLGQNRSAENMAIAKRENSVILLEDDYKQRYEGFDPNSAESYIMFEFMQDNYMNQSIQFASTIQSKFVANGRYDR
ncbi:MAG: N-acetylmuramoyl-L-alanine amidase, partial [Bacteroidia bacterium]|nr:N-acetylmuramoyl-L-alanine amidase [Bacteroidia bacterium]